MALTTLEKVKEFLGLKSSQAEADALLSRMIDMETENLNLF